MMKKMLVSAAMGEGATAMAFLIVPSVVGQLLFGAELTGIAVILARLFGIALLGLSVACWSGTPLIGMLTYGAAAMFYLAYVGFAGGMSGVLLWPVVAMHVVLTAVLARVLTSTKEPKTLRAV